MDFAAHRKELQGKIQQSVAEARGVKLGEQPKYDRAMADMQGSIGLLADLGNEQIARGHDELTKQTRRLVVATWILFSATAVLAAATVFEIFGK